MRCSHIAKPKNIHAKQTIRHVQHIWSSSPTPVYLACTEKFKTWTPLEMVSSYESNHGSGCSLSMH